MPHRHNVYDSDPHFSIDVASKSIINKSSKKIILVKGAHKSEKFTFDVPKTIEGHDMSLCDKVQVHYINIGATDGEISEDVYDANDFQASKTDENVLVFSWLLDGNATMYTGTLNFSLWFFCTNGDILEYSWGTVAYKGITVSDSYNNSKAVVEKHSDVLAAWENKIESQITGFKQTQTSIEDGGANVFEITFASGAKHEMRIMNGSKGSTGEKGEKGERGVQGVQGLQGEKGDPGEQGIQGEQGVRGERGEQGKQGNPGASAYETAVKNGFIGSETEWLASLHGKDGKDGKDGEAAARGDDGDSAYAIALKNGFVGDEKAWLDSLKGEKGDPGEKGEKGDQGNLGETGAPGASAYNIASSHGFEGTEEEWLTSLKGEQGEKGEKGDKGDGAEALAEYVKSTAQMVTATGTPLLIDGAIPFPHKVKVTVKDNTPKNLVPYPYAFMYDANGELIPEVTEGGKRVTKVETDSGLTITVNSDDGSITIKGVAKTNTCVLLYDSKEGIAPLKLYTYYTRGQGNPSEKVRMRFRQYYNNSDYTFLNDGYSSAKLNDNAYGLYMDLYVYAAQDLTNGVTFYPMIVEGEKAEISDYVPPAAMNPMNAPVPITLKTSGKNLLPYPYDECIRAGALDVVKTGITFTVNEDGTIIVNGTAEKNTFFSMKLNNSTYLTLPNHSMWLSGCPSGGAQSAYKLYIADNRTTPVTQIIDFGNGVAIPKGFEYNEIAIRIQAGYKCNNLVFKPQIEYGPVATAYEPYINKGETVVVNDGETVEVDNILPCMAISSDSDYIILTAEYPERVDKTIEKLTQAIISFGGKV